MGATTGRTVAELVAARWGDHRPGLWFEGGVLTQHEVAAGAAVRAALLADLLPAGAEPHIGVLLDNTLEAVRVMIRPHVLSGDTCATFLV